jgi:hypothetical protein
MRTLALVVLVACSSKQEPRVPPEERAKVLDAAKQCTDSVAQLAPSYQAVGPKLANALKMDRAEAQRLLRDSIELLISTRELLCSVASAVMKNMLEKAPGDREFETAATAMSDSMKRLRETRAAYDALLGAASSADHAPVDEAAFLERLQRAIVGN